VALGCGLALGQRDELVAEVDERHPRHPAPQLQRPEHPLPPRERLVKRADLERDVVDAEEPGHTTETSFAGRFELDARGKASSRGGLVRGNAARILIPEPTWERVERFAWRRARLKPVPALPDRTRERRMYALHEGRIRSVDSFGRELRSAQ
jgi:hypothetical protein